MAGLPVGNTPRHFSDSGRPNTYGCSRKADWCTPPGLGRSADREAECSRSDRDKYPGAGMRLQRLSFLESRLCDACLFVPCTRSFAGGRRGFLPGGHGYQRGLRRLTASSTASRNSSGSNPCPGRWSCMETSLMTSSAPSPTFREVPPPRVVEPRDREEAGCLAVRDAIPDAGHRIVRVEHGHPWCSSRSRAILGPCAPQEGTAQGGHLLWPVC